MKKTSAVYNSLFKSLGYCFVISYCPVVFANPEILQTATNTADFEQEFYLDTILNQSPKTILGHFTQRNNELLISKATLKDLARVIIT